MIETFADAFSGIGGFRKPLEEIGLKCKWSCDWSKEANYVYYRKFNPEKGTHFAGDIRRVNPEKIPNFDLFCAGFPCPSFSVAGKREGFNDKRGEIFFEIPRIAKVKRPKMLLLENVPGILFHDEGRTFKVILNSLEKLGYWVEWQILNSKYFGVPQNRERVFIVGHLGKGNPQPIFPIAEGNKISNKELERGQGITSCLDANYYKGSRKSRTFVMDFYNQRVKNEDLAGTLRSEGTSSWSQGTVLAFANTITDGWLMDTSHHSNPMSHYRIRRLTPIECERLQGFPDRWTEGLSDTARYRLLGNAVTTNVVKFLGERIMSSITNMGDREK